MQQSMEDLAKAEKHLAKAIGIHEEHLDSDETPTDASQIKLMKEMEAALSSLRSHAEEMKG